MDSTNCPSEDALDLLLREQLTEELRPALEDHVESCPACQRALDRLCTATERDDPGRHGRPPSTYDVALLRRIESQGPPPNWRAAFWLGARARGRGSVSSAGTGRSSP